jgi:hypothetical protein
MKRPNQDVAGRPRVHHAKPDVAGRSAISRKAIDLAAYRQHRQDLRDPMSTAADDAVLLEEFMDFLDGDDDFETATMSAPDPVFRERLRSRLWLNFVLARSRNGGDTH